VEQGVVGPGKVRSDEAGRDRVGCLRLGLVGSVDAWPCRSRGLGGVGFVSTAAGALSG